MRVSALARVLFRERRRRREVEARLAWVEGILSSLAASNLILLSALERRGVIDPLKAEWMRCHSAVSIGPGDVPTVLEKEWRSFGEFEAVAVAEAALNGAEPAPRWK